MTYETREEIEARIIEIKKHIEAAQQRLATIYCPIDRLLANDNIYVMAEKLGEEHTKIVRMEYRA